MRSASTFSSNSHKRKRAVSPLIATVLLIAFAVALGAVVMNWGRTYTEQTAANVKERSDVDVKCSLDVKLKIIEYANRPQICVGEWGADSYINATVLNAGEKRVESLKITMFGDSGVFSNASIPNSTIAVAGATKISAKYPYANTGVLRKVLIMPVVEINGKQTTCSGTGSTLEKESADVMACNSS